MPAEENSPVDCFRRRGQGAKRREGIRHFFIPSVVKDVTVSLRLGHAPALNVHRTFIHYRRAASLPCSNGKLG